MGGRLGERVGRGSLCLLLGLGGGLARPALASSQIDEKQGSLEQLEEDARRARTLGELLEVRLYAGSGFEVGSDYDEFRATSYEPNGRLKLTLPVAKDAALRAILRGSAQLTDFDDVSTDLFGAPTTSDPFGNLYATSIQLQGGWRPGWTGLFSDEERWTLVAEGSVRARWEEGARFLRALGGGGALGVGYQVGDWLEVILGVGVDTSLTRGGIGVHPVFELDWHFAERWTLRTRGRGAQLEYDLLDDLTLFASAQLESRSSLARERGTLGDEGRLREKGLPVGLGLRWDLGEFAELTLTGGVRLRQELRAEDEDGDDVGHVRAGPAPFVGLTLELRPERRRRSNVAEQERQRLSGDEPSSTSISTSR
jgi:hypothetical protein